MPAVHVHFERYIWLEAAISIIGLSLHDDVHIKERDEGKWQA